jgi:hypothetical protein
MTKKRKTAKKKVGKGISQLANPIYRGNTAQPISSCKLGPHQDTLMPAGRAPQHEQRQYTGMQGHRQLKCDSMGNQAQESLGWTALQLWPCHFSTLPVCSLILLCLTAGLDR